MPLSAATNAKEIFQSGETEHRVPELDGIRAIAVWMVLLAHAFYGFPNAPGALDRFPSPILQVISHGWLGVDLFFLLSGFLITGILFDTKNRPQYFRSFYVRRVLRIMPLYFACIAVWSVFYSHSAPYFLLSSIFGANLSGLFGIHEPHGPGVLWSLAVEEHFYLVWPLIVLLVNRRTLLLLSACIFIATPFGRGMFAAHGMNPDLIYSLSWFRFDGLAAGALMAIWARSSFALRKSAFCLSAALVVSFGLLSVIGARFGLFETRSVTAVALRYTQVYFLFAAAFVVIVGSRGARWTAPLRWRFMQVSGALSYCLYLVHLSIGDAYESLVSLSGTRPSDFLGGTGALLLRVVVMVTASFVVAAISRRYLEEPFLALKSRFAPRPNQGSDALTQPASSSLLPS